MNKYINKTVLLSIGLIIFGSGVSIAKNNNHSQENHQKKIEKLTTLLDLSEDQSTEIKSLFKKNRSQNKTTRKHYKKLKAELNNLLKSDASNEEVLSKHKEMQLIKNKMDQIRFNKTLAIRNLLNKEQREKFVETKKQRHHSKKRKF
ncbi:hypothetical protein BVY03_04580 [bacterium K02(2017)]|nr:hypothetical protein BVY03_04580 [bacterium K02(2017)]